MLSRKSFLGYLCGLLLLGMAVLVSCGKENTSTAGGLNVQLLIANLSPDLYPVEFYINNIRQGSATTYSYNATPAYASLTPTSGNYQIRTPRRPELSIFNLDTALRSDSKYSLFVVGRWDDAAYPPKGIFLADDTAAIAPVGKGGRLRFINASPGSINFDVWANGTVAIKNVKYSAVSPYITLPPGGYTFRIFAAGASATELASTSNINIQDGRLYTLYTRGIPNRPTTDTARLSVGYILNNQTTTR